MILLDTAAKELQVVLGEAISGSEMDFYASYVGVRISDNVVMQYPALGGVTNKTTPATVIPASGTDTVPNQVNFLSFYNADSISHEVTVQVYDGSSTFKLVTRTVAPGESLFYSKDVGFFLSEPTVFTNTNIEQYGGDAVPGLGQMVMAASISVALASDQPPVGITGSVTADQGDPASASGRWPVYLTDGSNETPAMDAVGRAGFQKITNGTNVAEVDADGAVKVVPSLPATSPLSEEIIDISSSGDSTVISGVGGDTIRVFKLFLVVDGATEITFKDGSSTALTGPISLGSKGSIVLDLSSIPWFTTSADEDFVVNSSNTVQISGRIYYEQS